MNSTKSRLFWIVYKDLEKEVLELTKNIHVNDKQLDVYSMHIADLLVRCSMEIETLCKSLYAEAGGGSVYDKDGKERDLYFDTDCLKYLNDKWSICSKSISVTSARFFFQDEANITLLPLRKADERGKGDWKKAYQAVKHDRANNLAKGNLKHLIRALGALYILNLFFADETIQLGVYNPLDKFDKRMGSSIFSVSFVDVSVNFSMGVFTTDEAINKNLRDKMAESIYVLRCNPEPWEKLQISYKDWNNHMASELGKSEAFVQDLPDKKDIERKPLYSLVEEYTEHNPWESYKAYVGGRSFADIPKEAVIYKNQPIYG